MKLIEFTPFVIRAVGDEVEINQSELTEKVFGTSGRGNTNLTNILFPLMIRQGYLIMIKKGRSKVFSLTEKGLDYYDQVSPGN